MSVVLAKSVFVFFLYANLNNLPINANRISVFFKKTFFSR